MGSSSSGPFGRPLPSGERIGQIRNEPSGAGPNSVAGSPSFSPSHSGQSASRNASGMRSWIAAASVLGSVVTMAKCGGPPRPASARAPKGRQRPGAARPGMRTDGPASDRRDASATRTSVHRQQAAPLATGSPEHGRRADGIGPRVDRPESAGGILGPARNQAQCRTSKRRSPVSGWRRGTDAGSVGTGLLGLSVVGRRKRPMAA
jgi:hypothetical protein